MAVYNTLEPHPNVVAKWKETNYLPDTIRIPRTESQAFVIMGQGQVISIKEPLPQDPNNPRIEQICVKVTEDPQRPIKRQIHKAYRIRENDKEYFFYVQRLDGENFQGDKPVDVTQVVGKYEEPEFTISRNRETGVKTITGHKDGVPKYEIPYTTGKFIDPSTGLETNFAELSRFLAPKTWFYVYTSGRKYELISITFDQFTTASYDDLVYFAIHNAWPEKKKVVKE